MLPGQSFSMKRFVPIGNINSHSRDFKASYSRLNASMRARRRQQALVMQRHTLPVSQADA